MVLAIPPPQYIVFLKKYGKIAIFLLTYTTLCGSIQSRQGATPQAPRPKAPRQHGKRNFFNNRCHGVGKRNFLRWSFKCNCSLKNENARVRYPESQTDGRMCKLLKVTIRQIISNSFLCDTLWSSKLKGGSRSAVGENNRETPLHTAGQKRVE